MHRSCTPHLPLMRPALAPPSCHPHRLQLCLSLLLGVNEQTHCSSRYLGVKSRCKQLSKVVRLYGAEHAFCHAVQSDIKYAMEMLSCAIVCGVCLCHPVQLAVYE